MFSAPAKVLGYGYV